MTLARCFLKLLRAGVVALGSCCLPGALLYRICVTACQYAIEQQYFEIKIGGCMPTRSSREPRPAPAASYPPNSPTPVVVSQAVAGTRRLRRVLRDMHAVYSVADQVARTDVQLVGEEFCGFDAQRSGELPQR